MDVVRFKKVEVDEASEDEEDAEGEEEGEAKKPVTGPVTIWIGVFPESASATAAHDAAQGVLALLKDYQITDVDIEFRESFYTREVGPQLHRPASDLDLLLDVISPLTPALGLPIFTKARPDAQGTMALYLAEGGGSDRLLGLSCRHVLIGSEQANIDYVCHPSRPPRDVLLLGRRAFTNLVDSIKLGIRKHGFNVKHWGEQIEGFKEEEEEEGTNAVDVEKAKAARIETQRLLDTSIWSTRTGENSTTAFSAIFSAPQPSLSASVSIASRRTGEFSRSTAPNSVTASRAIRWTSVRFDYPAQAIY